jgi:HK97 family phage portal protein
MGGFSINWGSERRSEIQGQSSIQNVIKWILGGMSRSSSSGETVDEESALTLSAVWSAVRLLSETIAMLPAHVCMYDAKGNLNIVPDHKLYRLIHDEPSPYDTSFTFRETMQANVTLNGNAYALIIRKYDGLPVEFEQFHPSMVTPEKKKNGIFYKVDGISKLIPARDMLHVPGLSFDGLKGYSPIEVAKEAIGLGIALQKFGGEFFANGASFGGIVEYPGKLSDPAQKNIIESIKKKFTGSGNRHKIQVFEEGMKYTPIGIPPEQAQFILTRKFQVSEIARIFRVPAHLINDLEKASFSNIEQQAIEFVQYSILPWVIRWEQELNRKIFTDAEKGKYVVKFNIDGLLRADAASRANYLKERFYSASITPNEIRKYEGQNDIGPDGDKFYIPANMVPVDSLNNTQGNG